MSTKTSPQKSSVSSPTLNFCEDFLQRFIGRVSAYLKMRHHAGDSYPEIPDRWFVQKNATFKIV